MEQGNSYITFELDFLVNPYILPPEMFCKDSYSIRTAFQRVICGVDTEMIILNISPFDICVMLIIVSAFFVNLFDIMFYLLNRAGNALPDFALYPCFHICVCKNAESIIQYLVSTMPYNDARAFFRQFPDDFTLSKIDLSVMGC